jgi:hypothetical protein
MKLNRLMAIVAVIAIDIAAVRVLFACNVNLPRGVSLIGVALQVGLYRLATSRGPARTFWAGFVASGLMAMSSFVLDMIHPVLSWDAHVALPGTTPAPGRWTVWSYYGQIAWIALQRLPYSASLLRVDGLLKVITLLVFFLPQMLFACTGGLLARRIFGRWLTLDHG